MDDSVRNIRGGVTTRASRWQVAPLLGCVGAVALFGSVVVDSGIATQILWRSGVLCCTATVLLALYRTPAVHRSAMVGVAAIGARIAATTSADEGVAAHWILPIANLAVGVALFVAAIWLSTRRRGGPDGRFVIDGLVAGIGASLVTWMAIVMPAIDRGMSLPSALLVSIHLPIATMTAAYIVDFWLDGLIANRAAMLIVAATIADLGGSVLYSLLQVDEVGIDVAAVMFATQVAAMLLLYLAASHTDIRAVFDRSVTAAVRPHAEVLRLVPIVTAMLAPICLIALVSPVSDLDRTIRVFSALACSLALLARLRIATATVAASAADLTRRLQVDELTGLPTRAQFVNAVSESLDRTWRSERLPTVIHLSLDRFKNINDSFGHSAANETLVAMSQRLRAAAEVFGGSVSRTAGDEFAVLDSSIRSTSQALALADEFARIVGEPIVVADSMVFVTASIGLAVAPRNRTIQAEELMRRADIAVHQAKTLGRNRVALFDESMQANLTTRMELEQALHGAIGRREMRLYQQPIVDIATGRLSGFEALMRWERDGHTVLPPIEFIPIAEETGLINELGAWALQEALCDLRGWIDEGIAPPTTTMSVNVSPRQLADVGFPAVVRKALDISGVPAHLLWIEMTESMMINEPELAQRTLQEVRSMGVRIALDDFGTGYSSLSLLQKFPIQRIKIDRAFINGIVERHNDRSLVRTIIAMAQSMGLDLVAEGIETIHQLQSLRELGCDKAQGYLISRPVPREVVRSTIEAIAELSGLSMFQLGGDATAPVRGPISFDATIGELVSHGMRPFASPRM